MLPEEGRLYLKFKMQPETKLDDGEAAALAIALHRSAHLVSDDGAAQRKATSHGVPWLDTGNFVRQALPRQLRLIDS
jgi:predicted nucleic acid-binding protein